VRVHIAQQEAKHGELVDHFLIKTSGEIVIVDSAGGSPPPPMATPQVPGTCHRGGRQLLDVKKGVHGRRHPATSMQRFQHAFKVAEDAYK